MEKASIIGVDLAKHVFQLHGCRRRRVGGVSQEDFQGQAAAVSVVAAAMCGGDGGLWWSTPLGPQS